MEKGLTAISAKEKLKIFGKNEIVTKESRHPLILLLSQFPTFINLILFAAAVFSFVISDFIDGIFIFAILILNALFGFIQEYRAEKSLEKLKNYITPSSRVIRDSKEIQIPTKELVPEDLVVLSEGDSIPADGKLISGNHVELDESILTGESMSVSKTRNDKIFGGTLIIKGKGYLLIEKTGMETRFGQIAKTLSILESDKSPLQLQLSYLGKVISLLVVIIAIILINAGILQGKPLFPLILLGISIGIAAIPEGLPAVITVALAIGTNKMAKKNAIVRKMQSVETLGAVKVILTDKTGTLTQNRMKVKKFWVRNSRHLSSLFRSCIYGNTASLIKKNITDANMENADSQWDTIGDRTDGALLLFAKKYLPEINAIKKEGKILEEYPFDTKTKTITTVIEKDNKKHIYVRGAPETLMNNLSMDEKEKVTSIFEEYAKEGLRVIAFASKVITDDELKEIKNKDNKLYEKGLTFTGLAGIYDPPRKEAKEAVKNAKIAGIQTIMVTGDNELTALSIAKEIELIEKDEDVITGEELEKITDEELEKIILKTRIFARAKPEDKLRLVSVLKKLNIIVGVTGDGVNDALALKRADVGIAMGETGTDVAKEASDIILTDDNFSTIVNAVGEGRTIYKNILNSVTYLLSGNIAELSIVFFAAILGMPNPFYPTQILWLNLVTDGLPALALASDIKSKDILKHSPRKTNAPFLTINRIIFIVTFGLLLAVGLLALFKYLLITSDELYARTMIFNLLVFIHLVLIFIIRRNSILHMNKFLAITIVLTIIMQTAAITFPFLKEIFHLN